MKSSNSREGQSASERIDKRIAELGDWRGETLSRMRKLVKQADPDVVEEVKWVKPTNPGTPTWSHDGIICTGESYKSVVKLTFAKGASLKDPAKLFNSSLAGNTRRAIDIREGEKVDAGAFKALIRAAVALNTSVGAQKCRSAPGLRVPNAGTERHQMAVAGSARSAHLEPNDLRASSCELAQPEPRFSAVLVTFPT